MPQPFVIENDRIRMDVWPQLGGKISSIIDKADNFQLMFNYPAEVPGQNSQYDLPYGNGWYAGWDECFPAVAPSTYTLHPYKNIAVPDHGELWSLPTTSVPAKGGITSVWHGLRFGYRLTRRLALEDASLIAEYTLVNLAPFEFRFVWALHGLLSMSVPVELDFPNQTAARWSHDATGRDIQTPFDWPLTGDGHSLTRPHDLPPQRAWKVFLSEPIQQPMTIRYPTRSRSLTVQYSSEDHLPAYWGLWINTGGWAGHRNFAVEPTTGRFDQIDRAIRDGSAGTVAPLGKTTWTVRWTLG